MTKIISPFYYVFFILTGIPLSFLSFLIWITVSPFDPNRRVIHMYTQYWESFLLLVIPSWKIKVVGKEKIDKNKAYVIISNHQSEFDILIASKLYTHFKWVSKESVFKVPIIGWNMQMNKYIALKRGDRKSIVHMMKESIANLKKGNSVWIFPEGTRSITGLLRPMSSGAFVIAQKAQADILPVVINGTKNIMLKGAWTLNFKASISIEVLDPIAYNTFKDQSPEDIAVMVREKISRNVLEHIEKEKQS